MPSTLRRTQHRALDLTRSLATVFKGKIFPDKNQSCSPFPGGPKYYDISRPRQLRRAQLPTSEFIHIIHRLPVELLAHVFVLGSEEDVMFPVRISHVCHKWRHIALHTPTLWRRIMLGPSIDMWKERISRAGTCTLDVQLLPLRTARWQAHHREYLDATTVQWYFHLVTALLQRWRSLEVVFTDYSPYLWNAALSGLCSRSRRALAPAMRDLTLVYRANDDTKEFTLFGGYAPNLRNVTLDGIRLTWLPSLFSNLTYLDYTHHGFTVGHQAVFDVINVLEVSSRLVELRILFPPPRLQVYHTRSNPVTRRVILSSLQHLHLRVEGSDIPFELAHLMTLVLSPSLISLSLIDIDHRYTVFPSLKSFFYVFAIPPSLRSLRIEHRWYDPRMVSPIVSALPHLRQVVVRRPQMPDQVLNLTYRKGLPNIHDFFHPSPPHIFHANPNWKLTSSRPKPSNEGTFMRPTYEYLNS
ncbi:hypothetical protein H0H93_014620 [Arthromyces matolae]|nr:hypothetical protein H0H93_014620 [Arthromyces matolae]